MDTKRYSLKSEIIKKGFWTSKDFAKASGLKESQISGFLLGTINPIHAEVKTLAKFLKLRIKQVQALL